VSIKRDVVTVTTDSSGAATAYSSEPFCGHVLLVRYVKTDFANGVDFTITTETTAQTIWTDTDINASETVRPRALCQGTDGANLTAEYHPPICAKERIKVIIAQGGDTTSGTFTFVVDEPDYRRS